MKLRIIFSVFAILAVMFAITNICVVIGVLLVLLGFYKFASMLGQSQRKIESSDKYHYIEER